MKYRGFLLLSACITSLAATPAMGGSLADANKLGSTLTPTGANPNANADGSIPAWNPNGPKVPESFDATTGSYPNPYSDEEKLFSITAENMNQYADHLTEGSKEMLKKFGDDGFRMDIYPSHRDYVPAEWIATNTKLNAEKASIAEDGLKVEGSAPGIPFPVPKSGIEAIWNHIAKPSPSHEISYANYYVTTYGEPIMATKANAYIWMEGYDPANVNKQASDIPRMKLRIDYTGPARRAGESLLIHETGSDFTEGKGRTAWRYMTGQRRSRLAPQVAFDKPNPAVAGTSTYDDAAAYNGSPERYNWKLVGKKEMYIPYNNYEFVYETHIEDALDKRTLNPDFIRWEKHRVWVVEANLKKGERHKYKKRRFYLDEDTWAAVTTDSYGSRSALWRVQLLFTTYLWDKGTAYDFAHSGVDLLQGYYNVNSKPIPGRIRFANSKKPIFYTPNSLARKGVR